MHINITKNTKTGNVSLPTKKGRCCTRSMATSSRGRDALATQQARAAVHVTIDTRSEGAPVEVSRIVGAATTLHIRDGTTCREISHAIGEHLNAGEIASSTRLYADHGLVLNRTPERAIPRTDLTYPPDWISPSHKARGNPSHPPPTGPNTIRTISSTGGLVFRPGTRAGSTRISLVTARSAALRWSNSHPCH